MQEMNFTKGLISMQVSISEILKNMKISSFVRVNLISINQVCICVCVCVYLLYSYCEYFFLQLIWTNDSKEEICCKEGCSFQLWVLYALLSLSVVSNSLQPHGARQAPLSMGVLQARILEILE